MAVMILFGWVVFSEDRMVCMTDPAPTYNAFIYSLEVFVPLVDLHHERYFLPSGAVPGSGDYSGCTSSQVGFPPPCSWPD
jgi:hypothetical protein